MQEWSPRPFFSAKLEDLNKIGFAKRIKKTDLGQKLIRFDPKNQNWAEVDILLGHEKRGPSSKRSPHLQLGFWLLLSPSSVKRAAALEACRRAMEPSPIRRKRRAPTTTPPEMAHLTVQETSLAINEFRCEYSLGVVETDLDL
ncbi:hypothetical protein AT3G44435 [Arabidopsis thaliana]|jgi:hypothetical protein|uniref:Uncharacterized protein n=2 Tax=Arabidopsis thaliana TaxID=3702 RepID=A0A5S9XI03_ARATH|nr:uncharacterized protein AT3G44435 [Arabidopsis thaliana]ANM65908.1 hypothetical protein AT3G44435 [Arabidopsis thaliana]CAA0384442.1 unnamed protein product [Arabidopsis thaliana]|eukprot:NP_001327845.1 hypothetical protein AT3G44435 [Arabidopsis thaliana]